MMMRRLLSNLHLWVLLIVLSIWAFAFWPAFAQPVSPSRTTEVRVCFHDLASIPRNADGSIRRSNTARNAFIKAHPCPVTHLSAFPCDGWQIDHVIPLACGGCDAVWNMQWLPESIKKDRGHPDAKDRWELEVYCPARSRQ
jgi:hypothetical protein